MKRLLIILILTAMTAGCTPEVREVAFMDASDISLTWKGSVQVMFNEQTCQLAYNDQRNEYRVYDDKLGDWFVISCSQRPVAEGELITADVSWTGDRTPKSYKGLEFIVRRVSEDGLIWLWNERNKIGIIVKDIV